MTTIQQQTFDTLTCLGYDRAHVTDGVGTPSFTMEAANSRERALVASLAEEHTWGRDYMMSIMEQARNKGINTVVLVACSQHVMELFDAYNFHALYPELTFTWFIFK